LLQANVKTSRKHNSYQ